MRLFSFERRWWVALIDAVYPSGADPRLPKGAADSGIDRFVDELFAAAPQPTISGIRILGWILNFFAPLLALGVPRRFVALSVERRTAVLEKLSHSPVYALRELPSLIKMLGGLGYCALPAVQRQVGIALSAPTPDWAKQGDR